MFEQRRFERRVGRAAKSLFLEILSAGRFTDKAQPSSAFAAGSVLRSWPIDQLTGGDYRFISEETVTAAVRGLAWWLIAFLDSYIEPEKPSFEHQATAELLVPLRDDVRGRLLERDHPVDHERVLGVISTVLTGRQPDVWEGTVLVGAHYMLATSMRQLVEESPRAAERLATGAPLVTERPADAPERPARLAASPPGQPGLIVPEAWYYWPDEADKAYQEQRRQWHLRAANGEEDRMPLRDPNRCVFLEDNMPAELKRLSVTELTAVGVREIPGQQACEYLIATREMEIGMKLTPEQEVEFIRHHLEVIRLQPSKPLRLSGESPDLTLPPLPQTRLRPSAEPPDLTLPPLPERRPSSQ